MGCPYSVISSDSPASPETRVQAPYGQMRRVCGISYGDVFGTEGGAMLWVGEAKISKKEDVPKLYAATEPFIADDVVRAFIDWAEALAFATETTDYIGNLPGPAALGTWVRFDKTFLNIIGEEHDYVSLEQTTAAVRTRSFIYEQFATDILLEGSAFRAAYLTENTALLEKFGVVLDSDLTLVGGESLFPKIADTVAELVPYFDEKADMQDMTSVDDNYLGQPDQRYLKIGWAWAKDLVGNTVTEAEKALALAVTTYTGILDSFITSLPVDGFLGDPLIEEEHGDKYAPLLALCQAYVPVMIERACGDLGITEGERLCLSEMRTETVKEQQDMFGLWRNLYFAKATEKAAERGVRYAGMGDYHREWLMDNDRVPDNAHTYNVSRTNFINVIKLTDTLRTL